MKQVAPEAIAMVTTVAPYEEETAVRLVKEQEELCLGSNSHRSSLQTRAICEPLSKRAY